MYYAFIVKSVTNEPIETEVELQDAIDRHPRLKAMNLFVTGRELSAEMDPLKVGLSHDGDPWRFIVEGEIDAPVWVLQEIRKAIRNHSPISQLELQANEIVRMASPAERRQTVDEVERWLKISQQRRR